MFGEMIKARCLSLILLTLIGGLLMVSPCWANLPLAGQHYPNGAEDFVTSLLPPPGFYLKAYIGYIHKDDLMGDDGKSLGVDFNVDVNVFVSRFIWTTGKKIGGASHAMHLFLPTYNANVDSAALGINSNERGLGDIIFDPILLGWTLSPNLHMVTGVDIYIPTGNYDENNAASQLLSKNHWTIEPVVSLTYLNGPLDITAKMMYDFNTTNDEYSLIGVGSGELDPGQEFHVDWAIGYVVKEGLRVGLSGYSYWQTTEDEFTADAGGATIKGDKGEVHAVGPTIKYWPNMGPVSATLKHTWEFGTENLPEGESTWLNIIYAF